MCVFPATQEFHGLLGACLGVCRWVSLGNVRSHEEDVEVVGRHEDPRALHPGVGPLHPGHRRLRPYQARCRLLQRFEALFLKIELGIIIGGGYKIMKLLERVEVSVDGAFFKLQMLEKRLEHLVEPGAEAARHIQQIIVDLSGPKHQ